MRNLQRIVLCGLLLAGGLGLSAAGGSGAAAAREGRGDVVAVQRLRPIDTAGAARAELAGAGFDIGTVRFGVDMYQVVYRTIDPAGRPTVASGLLALPRSAERQLRVVSYAHGTELNRTDAPSMWRDGWSVGPAITYASAGFAAVAPDYLGMGLGPGPHPYLHLPSETTASVDLLRAARTVAAEQGRTLRREVYVTGFSQGASAATALGKALLSGADPWFRLGALAPISGAYDLRGVELHALLTTVPWPYDVGYLGYLLVAWNRLHDLPGFFDPGYAGRVEALYDGVHTGDDLVETLPQSPAELLSDEGLAQLEAPTGRFAEALAEHDASCTGHRFAVPTRLFAARSDEQVPVTNSEHCAAVLRAPVVDTGIQQYQGSVHLGSNIAGTAQAVRWFAQLG
ncbi:lipase [Dactylosporangium sp. NPDC005572]|uniref:alpha/beta hydrolase family protein n=1 Tax=Dactylosporangium sp. NPDC005572 TaxID=3156889 RepID=UPI0033A13341